ncbi:hypothetical protein ACT2X7_000106 [Campylobacter coli]
MTRSKIAKFFTFWIPIRKIRKKIRQKIENLLYIPYIKKIQQTQFDIQQKIKSKKISKLNIAFFVMYDSIFPAKTLFENMNKISLFNTHLIVIPDITKGEENMYFQMTKPTIPLVLSTQMYFCHIISAQKLLKILEKKWI